MKLIEAEAEGPVEGEAAVVTPPRPPHRRVSISLVFTLTVLIGTVVAIYLTFPARDHQLLTEALARARTTSPSWDLATPPVGEVRAWALGVVGKTAPLPVLDGPETKIVGVMAVKILGKRTAIIGLEVGPDRVTYLVQHAKGIAPKRTERVEGDLRAIAWRNGPYAIAVAGPAASQRWPALFP